MLCVCVGDVMDVVFSVCIVRRVSVGSTLASKINDNSCNPRDYMQSNVKSMAIPNSNENDATLVINSLNNSSPGWDNIPASIVKQVIHWYIKPLVFLINQSLIKGVFPDELKLAKKFPVYKDQLWS